VVSTGKFGLEGIEVHDLKVFPDERGFFSEALRHDWKDLLKDEWIAQVNLSYSYPGVVRAWHRHLRGQVDYFLVIEGSMKICAYDDEEDSPTKGVLAEVIGSKEKPQVIRIPGHYWHGTKTVSSTPSLTVYFVSKLYDYTSPDEQRRPWNDPTIVPMAINGKTDDLRTGSPWDWLYLPFK
jgi:dTDP-4-dehydrorhamnose 3,5-epimerase